jgi:Protein of unknown function (DUF3592)
MGIIGLRSVERSMSLVEPVPSGLQAIGTVVRSHAARSDSCTYQPTIEFRDVDGQTHRFTAPYQAEYPAIGSKVRVSYASRDPANAHDISLGPSTWNLPLGTMISAVVVGGLATLGIAVILFRIAFKRRRHYPRPANE